MKLKIAVLGAKGIPHPGGIEHVMEEVGSRLVNKGHQFDIFVRRDYMKDQPISSYKGMGLPRSPGIHSKNLDAITHSLTALVKILFGGYEIVYFNSVGLSVLSWIPRLFGKKSVVHTHGLDWKREKWGRIAKMLIRFSAYTTARLPNLTICCGQTDKIFLEKHYGSSCQFIPNGAPPPVFRKPELIKEYGLKGKDYVLFMSRLVHSKGCHFLLTAWQEMSLEQKNGMKLIIAGDSNFKNEYTDNLRKEYEKLEDVIFTGFVTGDLREELLSNAYCFVQPSVLEGLPLSVLEALSYGLFVLTSDIQENKDAIRDCGATFKSGDVDDLKEKIKKIINMSRDEIEKEGIRARELARNEYNWDQAADKLEKSFISLFEKQNSKMKIAVLGVKGMPHPGGIEHVMEEVGSRMVNKGHQFDIFVRHSYMKDKPISSYKGMGLLQSPGIHTKHLDAITHSLTALVKILFGGYKIVYFNSVGLSVLSWIPRVFGKKTVVHIHGLDWRNDKWNRFVKKLLRISAYSSVKFPNITFCTNIRHKNMLEKVYGMETIVLRNGVPEANLRQPKLILQYGINEKDYILFLSRLVPEKGCHLLLKAWEGLPQDIKKGKKLVIAGDTKHRDKYYKRLLKYAKHEDIIFTGFAIGALKEELFSNAYCFIHPSIAEGLPVSVLEALSYGLYILASDIPENQDALHNCGAVFQSGNIIDLRLKIEDIINVKPEIMENERIKAIELARKEYNWDPVVDHLEQLLLEQLK
ncbi:MAG: glycosyltransferase family 4 protein [Thermodesulfovibrionia bacterium]|nr:glycosyltransferase family 4 protein [Thermodesulfovibrionia bacterium]